MNTPTYIRLDGFSWPVLSAIPAVAESLATMVLSGGSREHFFHFLLGYLLPLIHQQEQYKFNEFNVLDCGPVMTPILKETLERCGYSFNIIPLSEIANPYVVEKWDFEWQDISAVEQVVDKLRSAWANHACNCGGTSSTNVLIKRSEPAAYYLGDQVEIKGYGTSRREIKNWAAVSQHLTECGIQHEVYEPGVHSLGCQISKFSKASTIIGVRGAEWANLVWCNSNVKAVVYDPNPPAKVLTKLLDWKKVCYEFVYVDQASVEIEPVDIVKWLQ